MKQESSTKLFLELPICKISSYIRSSDFHRVCTDFYTAQNTTTTISIVRISDNTATHLCLKEFTQYNLFDAAWMTPTKFIACGTDTLQLFEIVSHSDSTYEIRLIQSHDMQRSWYRIKYDPVSQIAALVDQDYTLLRQYNVATEDTKTQAFTDSRISDFAFQPIPNPDSYDPTTTPRLLATSTKDGTIQLWDVLNPITCVHRLSLPAYGNTITMEQISFSPDGYLLAGAGYDTVAVWRPEEGGQPKAVWRCTDSDTWRSEPPETDKEGEDGWVHTLDWVSTSSLNTQASKLPMYERKLYIGSFLCQIF